MMINQRASRHGFTLIELVVVIVMIGVLAGMVIPRLPDVGSARLKSNARKVAGTITYLYNRSASTGLVLRLTIDMDENEIFVSLLNTEKQFEETELPFAKRAKLPGGVKVYETLTTTQGKIRKGKAVIHFFPGGATEPAVIHLIDSAKNELTLTTNPLTGRVKIEEGYVDIIAHKA